MLAIADRKGYVGASIPGLADAARVTIEECELALAELMAPDPYSRSTDHDGRRVEVADRGWQLLNYMKYRNSQDRDDYLERTRVKVAAHRARKRASDVTCNLNVTSVKPAVDVVTTEEDIGQRLGAPPLTPAPSFQDVAPSFCTIASNSPPTSRPPSELDAGKEFGKPAPQPAPLGGSVPGKPAPQPAPPSDEALSLAAELRGSILAYKPDHKLRIFPGTTRLAWARIIDRMVSLDRRSVERIRAVIGYLPTSVGDGNGRWRGWAPNVQSADALRRHFDKIELEMTRGAGGAREETWEETVERVAAMEAEAEVARARGRGER